MNYKNKQSGLSAVELLITLIIAAIFLIAGFQLFALVTKDSGETRTLANANNTASQYLQKYKSNSSLITNPCTANANALATTTVTIAGSINSTVQVAIDCPYTANTSISRITTTVTYGNPAKTIISTTYAKPLCPNNASNSVFVRVPGSATYGTKDFCVMKYEAKNVGGVAKSQASGTPWANVSQTQATTLAAASCNGCHLITEAEWLTIAADVVTVQNNWSIQNIGYYWFHSGIFCNGTSPAFTTPRPVTNPNDPTSDTPTAPSDCGNPDYSYAHDRSNRVLYLSNGEAVWDLSGNAAEWTSGQTTGGQPGASSLAWRAWTTSTLTTHGTLSPDPWPLAINTLASTTYNSTSLLNTETGWQIGFYLGLGRVQSNSSDNTQEGFIRGGSVGNGVYNTGVYALDLSHAPSWAGDSNTGFRVAL